ncbi:MULTISPECIES: pallilysin-related adhesin [unclassified Treponema]|uniref:pallilysin-related adhesin n=1 Tax=unclassified Treponema TaxID=2638727 RepID=UPI0020A49656|nr:MULTISPECIES: pallilysin-related adhesin [unclassified Treponema]UTC67353.1 pallilysin-related adhesin [Treponema sp. OMZ 789]UTC70081.1 pallilysin-related adhesin [Treponema sp. OMZ 790]UTC72797.1 pallilysin-related adhesin [Treponema sp. OMZ 791]
MFKRITYIISALIILIVLSFLIYFKFIQSNKKNEERIVTQTIIPIVSSQINNRDNKTETDSPNTEAKIFLELFNDEAFVDAISDDLNEDGVEDQIIAVKKLLDPFLYLIISIQNPITQKWDRIEEIRTAITQPKSLTFYIMNLAKDPKSLVYSGMTSDNRQILSIHTIQKDDNGKVLFSQIADLHADMQIQIKEIEFREENTSSLSSYRVYTYNSDPSAPNTLNQIETEYTWNAKTKKYEEGLQKTIPGEKIEIQLLRKLQSGNMESFIDFLSGLWFQQDQNKETGRSVYFDKNDSHIIFNLDNVEEIYEIKTTLPRRYGLFFTTNNKSIPNIIRRVEVEIKGVDEIQVRVIEDVLRIKFGTASLWNGNYKKNTNLLLNNSNQKENNAEKIKKLLSKSSNQWKSVNNNLLDILGNSYTFQKSEDIETGYFNILEINDKIILQMKSNKDLNKFYMIELTEKNGAQKMIWTKIKLSINDVIPTGDEPIIFERGI